MFENLDQLRQWHQDELKFYAGVKNLPDLIPGRLAKMGLKHFSALQILDEVLAELKRPDGVIRMDEPDSSKMTEAIRLMKEVSLLRDSCYLGSPQTEAVPHHAFSQVEIPGELNPELA